MYRQGFEDLVRVMDGLRPSTDAHIFLTRAAERFIDFAQERPSRYQLLFQRTVPGFVPSDDSFRVASGGLERMRGWLRDLGLPGERNLDFWRAVLLGLAGEQLSNDPGGRRWRRLAPSAVRAFVAFAKGGST